MALGLLWPRGGTGGGDGGLKPYRSYYSTTRGVVVLVGHVLLLAVARVFADLLSLSGRPSLLDEVPVSLPARADLPLLLAPAPCPHARPGRRSRQGRVCHRRLQLTSRVKRSQRRRARQKDPKARAQERERTRERTKERERDGRVSRAIYRAGSTERPRATYRRTGACLLAAAAILHSRDSRMHTLHSERVAVSLPGLGWSVAGASFARRPPRDHRRVESAGFMHNATTQPSLLQFRSRRIYGM